jgi:hypothetical protein
MCDFLRHTHTHRMKKSGYVSWPINMFTTLLSEIVCYYERDSEIVCVMIHACACHLYNFLRVCVCLCADSGHNKLAKTDHINLGATQYVQDINIFFKISSFERKVCVLVCVQVCMNNSMCDFLPHTHMHTK